MKRDIHKLADWLEELTAEGLQAERKLADMNQPGPLVKPGVKRSQVA